MPPFDFLPAMSQALGVINTINSAYQSYETKKYREAVLSGIETIEEDLSHLENVLDQLSHDLKFWQQWNAARQPLALIKLHYANYQENTESKDTTTVCNDLSDAMMAIHTAVCGEDSYGYALENYLATLESKQIMTSKVELLYQFFTRFLVGRMVRALGLLGAYKDSRFSTWQTLLTAGNQSATDDYLKQPFLKNEATICQGVANRHVGEDVEWAGCSDVKESNYSTNWLNVGAAVDIPDGHALVGFDFCEDEAGSLTVLIWHGPVGKDGYVTEVHKKYNGEDRTFAGAEFGGTYGNITTHYGFVDLNAVSVPDGNVITAVHLLKYRGTFDSSITGGTTTWSLVGLGVQYSPVVDGKVDSSQKTWTDLDSKNHIVAVRDRNDTWHVETPEGVADYSNNTYDQGQDDGQPVREWTHWSDYRSSEGPPQWTTPITGVRIHTRTDIKAWKAIFRADVHKAMFVPPE